MTRREHEPVPVQPERVLGVEPHRVPEQGHADCGGSHGGTGVPAFVGLDDIGRKDADRGEDERGGGYLQRRAERTLAPAVGVERGEGGAGLTLGLSSLLSSDTGKGVAVGMLVVICR